MSKIEINPDVGFGICVCILVFAILVGSMYYTYQQGLTNRALIDQAKASPFIVCTPHERNVNEIFCHNIGYSCQLTNEFVPHYVCEKI
jgi:hypothetical protein